MIQTLTRELGDETGLVLWDQISKILGDDARADIFFELLDPNRGGVIRIRTVPVDQLIPFIKLIRTCTSLGLKEAKDLAETVVGQLDSQSMPMLTLRVRKNFRETRMELLKMGAKLI
jgi:hypothetical protein